MGLFRYIVSPNISFWGLGLPQKVFVCLWIGWGGGGEAGAQQSLPLGSRTELLSEMCKLISHVLSEKKLPQAADLMDVNTGNGIWHSVGV